MQFATTPLAIQELSRVVQKQQYFYTQQIKIDDKQCRRLSFGA